MQRVILDQDVKPISEFRANAASLVQQVRRTKRPLVITQQGEAPLSCLTSPNTKNSWRSSNSCRTFTPPRAR